ncbi:hypothetical protein AAFF_G00434370 [Aldrovandia affinis]|uniref:Uncharacterized protein n=1 Tax=Aldrovandia affinis TaxID=143900 RepID=A0AAD7S8A4_9TELE|nr:hypothetical protein AAFF_G00434370 [Aldrovandia affinis]
MHGGAAMERNHLPTVQQFIKVRLARLTLLPARALARKRAAEEESHAGVCVFVSAGLHLRPPTRITTLGGERQRMLRSRSTAASPLRFMRASVALDSDHRRICGEPRGLLCEVRASPRRCGSAARGKDYVGGIALSSGRRVGYVDPDLPLPPPRAPSVTFKSSVHQMLSPHAGGLALSLSRYSSCVITQHMASAPGRLQHILSLRVHQSALGASVFHVRCETPRPPELAFDE